MRELPNIKEVQGAAVISGADVSTPENSRTQIQLRKIDNPEVQGAMFIVTQKLPCQRRAGNGNDFQPDNFQRQRRIGR